jgi:hypothetical protein
MPRSSRALLPTEIRTDRAEARPADALLGFARRKEDLPPRALGAVSRPSPSCARAHAPKNVNQALQDLGGLAVRRAPKSTPNSLPTFTRTYLRLLPTTVASCRSPDRK